MTLGFAIFLTTWGAIWVIAARLINSRGVSEAWARGFIIGLGCAAGLFRVYAITQRGIGDCTIYDLWVAIALLGSPAYLLSVYKRPRVALQPVTNRQTHDDGSGSVNGPATEAASGNMTSDGWKFIFISIVTIGAFLTMGFFGLLVVLAFAMMWRIIITLGEIRDQKKGGAE